MTNVEAVDLASTVLALPPIGDDREEKTGSGKIPLEDFASLGSLVSSPSIPDLRSKACAKPAAVINLEREGGQPGCCQTQKVSNVWKVLWRVVSLHAPILRYMGGTVTTLTALVRVCGSYNS
jgi:hypothetical protein